MIYCKVSVHSTYDKTGKGDLFMKNVVNFLEMKQTGEPIVMMTAYDYPSARLAEQQNIDMILVGDSLGMVVLGYDSTVSVTIDDMIHHAKAVRRGAPDTFVVVDMPFGTYHVSTEQAVQHAIQLFQQSNANAIKVEGAGELVPAIERIVAAGIPVVGHLGLQPQSAEVLGGYKVQGNTASSAQKLINDAKALEKAGVCAIVFECIPKQLGGILAAQVSVPIIGIGAGVNVDGQVLVYHDLLGYGDHRVPKFVEKFSDVHSVMAAGIAAYRDGVKARTFPSDAQSFTMNEQQLDGLYGGVIK